MTNIKKIFSTPRKTIISSVCITAALAAITVGSTFAASAAAKSKAIGEVSAQNKAYSDAKVPLENITKTKTTFDYEKGQYVYEVDFVADGTEYDYIINSSTGKIIEKTSEKADEEDTVIKNATAKVTTVDSTTKASPNSKTQNSSELISLDSAKAKALANAGVKAADAKFTQGYLDTDDGIKVYDLEFVTSDKEYDYEINAKTGAVIEKSVEKLTAGEKRTISENNATKKAQTTKTTIPTTVNSDVIGLETAKSKALADAGVKASAAKFTTAKLEYDDGIKVYEIDFYTSDKEYDYEINAKTGKIIDKESERIITKAATTSVKSSTTYIGVDKAKSIAVSHTGFSSEKVSFSKAKLESDDGIKVYEVEFFYDNYEYDYTINAKSGKIIEFEKDFND